MGKCPNCGEWNHSQSKNCVKCGKSLPKSKQTYPKATVIDSEKASETSSKGFWEKNGHIIAHVAMKLLFG